MNVRLKTPSTDVLVVASLILLTGLVLYPLLDGYLLLDDTVQFAWGQAVIDGRASLIDVMSPSPRDPFGGKDYINFRPVHWLIFVLLRGVFGEWTTGMHVFVLAMHIVVIITIYAFLRLTEHPPWTAWAAAALFAVNPVTVENVGWLSCITTITATWFHILTVLLFTRFLDRQNSLNTWRPIVGVTGFIVCGLALLTNEAASTTILVLFVVMLLDPKEGSPVFRSLGSSSGNFSLFRRVLFIMPFAVLTAGYLPFILGHTSELTQSFRQIFDSFGKTGSFLLDGFFRGWQVTSVSDLTGHITAPLKASPLALSHSGTLNTFMGFLAVVVVSGFVFRSGLIVCCGLGFVAVAGPYCLLWPITWRFGYTPAVYLAIVSAILLSRSGDFFQRLSARFGKNERCRMLSRLPAVITVSVTLLFVIACIPTCRIIGDTLVTESHENLAIVQQFPPREILDSYTAVDIVITTFPSEKRKFPIRYLGILVSSPQTTWYDQWVPLKNARGYPPDGILPLTVKHGVVRSMTWESYLEMKKRRSIERPRKGVAG